MKGLDELREQYRKEQAEEDWYDPTGRPADAADELIAALEEELHLAQERADNWAEERKMLQDAINKAVKSWVALSNRNLVPQDLFLADLAEFADYDED